MKVDECVPTDAHTSGGGERPPCAGLASYALPEVQHAVSAESSHTGVSTQYVHTATGDKDEPHWYALRATYGREKKAYDYMTAKGITAFHPITNIVRLIKGKRKFVTESRLPNIFFAYGTEEQLKSFVYDNVNIPFLRFYLCCRRRQERWENKLKLIDDSRAAVTQLKMEPEKTHHPIDFVDIDKERGCVTSKFKALIVGFGSTGQDALRFLYEYSAFADEHGDKSPVEMLQYHRKEPL